MNSSASMADPWNIHILFSESSPYFPMYFGTNFVRRCPLPMCLIVSTGGPFMHSVAQRSFLFIAPMALERHMSMISASRLACSMYCPILIIASIVEIPYSYPYWSFLVSMCVILVSCLSISPVDILYMICVTHMGLYLPESPAPPLFLYMYTIVPSVQISGISRPSFTGFEIRVIGPISHFLFPCKLLLVVHRFHALFCLQGSLVLCQCLVRHILGWAMSPFRVLVWSWWVRLALGWFVDLPWLASLPFPTLGHVWVLLLVLAGLCSAWCALLSILPIFSSFLSFLGIPPHLSSWLQRSLRWRWCVVFCGSPYRMCVIPIGCFL